LLPAAGGQDEQTGNHLVIASEAKQSSMAPVIAASLRSSQ